MLNIWLGEEMKKSLKFKYSYKINSAYNVFLKGKLFDHRKEKLNIFSVDNLL